MSDPTPAPAGTCTACDGTGYDPMMERTCLCQSPEKRAPMAISAPQPDWPALELAAENLLIHISMGWEQDDQVAALDKALRAVQAITKPEKF